MIRFLVPHIRLESVCQLTLDRLRQEEWESLLLDVDCTLARYREPLVAPDVAAWIEELRGDGIGLCLVSNGWGGRIGRLAEKLGVRFIGGACKPLPFRLKAAVRKMDFDPARTAMVGDQLFADVLAGRLAGLKTVLVRPIHPEDEPWFTRLKRGPERFLLRRFAVEVESAAQPARSR